MEKANVLPRLALPHWVTNLASLAPLWLLAVAVSAEGFPRPPVSIEVGKAAFIAGVAIALFLLLKGWMTIELAVYSLTPFIFLGIFDEITTTYKTPFIMTCALLLTAGALLYQRSNHFRLRWLILVVTMLVVWLAAWHATLSFWRLTEDLGYVRCFPDYHGCAPLTGNEPAWWIIFFRL